MVNIEIGYANKNIVKPQNLPSLFGPDFFPAAAARTLDQIVKTN